MATADVKSHLKFELKPIFQAAFAYVQRGNNKICSLQMQNYDFFKDSYAQDLNLVYPENGIDFIVPVPTTISSTSIQCEQHNKYYITNPSNITSLYNANHPNSGDTNYNMNSDMGSFFTLNNFTYEGFFLERGQITANDVGSLIYDTGMFAFDLADSAGLLKGVFKSVPYVGMVFTTIEIANSINDMIETAKYHRISDQKKIEYEASYNSREWQIYNGGLNKDAAVAIQSATEKKLLFGTGDSFTFYYQINTPDISVDTLFSTIINFGVMSVVSETDSRTSFGEIQNYTSSFSDKLFQHYDVNYREIMDVNIGDNLNVSQNVNILPDYDAMISFKPTYSGSYNFLKSNEYAKVTLFEASYGPNGYIDINSFVPIKGIKNDDSNVIFSLSCDKTYVVCSDLKAKEPSDHIKGRYGTFDLGIEFLPLEITSGVQINKQINPGEVLVLLYDLNAVDAFDYNVQAESSVEFQMSHTVLNNPYFYQNGTSLLGSLVCDDGKQFVRIINRSLVSQNVSISILASEAFALGETNDFDFIFQKVRSISLPYTMDVTLNLSSEDPVFMEIYDDQNSLIVATTDSRIKQLNFTILSNHKYFILVRQYADVEKSVSLTLKYNILDIHPGYNYYSNILKDGILLYNNDFSGDFQISSVVDVMVYDSQGNQKNAHADGSYTLIKNQDYYFNMQSNAQRCYVNLNIVYTEQTSGVFSDKGVVFVKYIPTETGEYSVQGADTYYWYNENFDIRYGTLNANTVYYLMVEGQTGQGYNVTISPVGEAPRTQLPLTMGVERNSGRYYFVVTQQGTYTIRTFRNSDAASSTVTIYDEIGTQYCTDICLDFTKLELFMLPGTYNLDLLVIPNSETITIKINKKR